MGSGLSTLNYRPLGKIHHRHISMLLFACSTADIFVLFYLQIDTPRLVPPAFSHSLMDPRRAGEHEILG